MVEVSLSKGSVEKLMDAVDLAYRYLGMIRCYIFNVMITKRQDG